MSYPHPLYPPPPPAPVPPPPPPPPARPHPHRALGIVAGVTVALVSCGVGAGIGLAIRGTPSIGSSSALRQPIVAPPEGRAQAAPPLDTSSAGGPIDAAGIATRVDPAIVDVTATLPSQGGMAAGTGMVITPTGQVLTNNHVVAGSASIKVKIAGVGPSYGAHVVGVDPIDDVAVLQIDNSGSRLATVDLGDSAKVNVGDPVVALGNALGRQGPPTLTQGFVTALDQSITAGDVTGSAESLSGLIQINALIQPGDSGGPLLNSAGRVIGMNTAAGGSRRSFGDATAFAIPSNTATSIVQKIQSGKPSDHIQIGQGALLGVEVSTTPQPVAGAPVVGVQPGGPAQAAGIGAGDVIVSLGGKNVDSPGALSPLIRAHRPGDTVDVGWQDSTGSRHHASVRLAAGPPA